MRAGTVSIVLSFGVFLLVAAVSLEGEAKAMQSTGGDAKLTKQLLGKLNAPLNRIKKANQSYLEIFDGYLDMTSPPMDVGDALNQTTVWPKMSGWSKVSAWAKANASMSTVLQGVQGKLSIGLPYGVDSVSSAYKSKNLFADVRIGTAGEEIVSLPYLNAIETIAVWSAAEQYRLCEESKYDEALTQGISTARMLRQLCDRDMVAEKFVAFRLLGECLSVQRDIMWSYLSEIPAEVYRKFATKEYPFLQPGDNERMKRLEMPEGDLKVAEIILVEVFDADGDPIPDKMSSVFGMMQSSDAPFTRFGASRRWEILATVHGSQAATQEKLTEVYDDWWRRWRIRQYDPIQALPTEFSRINEIRYAVVVESVSDMREMFEARNRLIVQVNGTVLSAGLCGYFVENGRWPNDLEKAYVKYIPKRFNFDPFDKSYGQFLFRYLGTRNASVDTEFGRIEVDGCMVYARGEDNSDENATESSLDGSTGDMVVWPALRAVARKQGLLN